MVAERGLDCAGRSALTREVKTGRVATPTVATTVPEENEGKGKGTGKQKVKIARDYWFDHLTARGERRSENTKCRRILRDSLRRLLHHPRWRRKESLNRRCLRKCGKHCLRKHPVQQRLQSSGKHRVAKSPMKKHLLNTRSEKLTASQFRRTKKHATICSRKHRRRKQRPKKSGKEN